MYSFQTFSFEQILTSSQMAQVEVNIRDHVHGRNNVLKTGVSFPVTDKTGAFTAVAGDVGEMFNCNGTFTITLTAAATLAAGWSIGITNDGSGTITIDGDGAETIDNAATITVDADKSVLLYCTGVEFFTIGGGGGNTWNIIGTAVASASASLTITGIDDTYGLYGIGLSDLVSASNQVLPWLRCGAGSIDSGVSDYGHGGRKSIYGGVQADFGALNGAEIIIGQNHTDTSRKTHFGGMIFLTVPKTGTGNPNFAGITAVNDGWNTGSVQYLGGARSLPILIDRVQFLFASGNITSGRMTVWGIAHA